MDPLLFDKSLYFKVLAVVLLVAGVGLGFAHWYYGQSDNIDTAGTIVSSAIIAYIVHLWMLSK